MDAPGVITTLTLEVDIRHTYIGDLRVALRRGDAEIELHRFVGGATRDLRRAYTLHGLVGLPRAGEYTLVVEDHVRGDEGTLRAWAIHLD